MAQTAGPTASWWLFVIVGVVAALVAVVLVAQLTDPERERRAAQRQALVGDAWRPRKVVRHVPAVVAGISEQDTGAGDSTAPDNASRPALTADREHDADGSDRAPDAPGRASLPQLGHRSSGQTGR